MRQLYADFNDIDADGNLPLTCVGSLASMAALSEPLREGERVWLSDGELRVAAHVFMSPGGTWLARSDWQYENQG